VVEVVEDDDEELACGDAGCNCFQRRGPWKPTTPRKTTPRTAATIFCFFSFALSVSTCLFAIYGAPVAEALPDGVSLVGVVVVAAVVVVVVLAAGGVATGAAGVGGAVA
jgi:hypothetical protein